MSSSLVSQFKMAHQHLEENQIEPPSELKWRLYGLEKQINVGDCKMPKPPSSNVILKSKWEAWMACGGLDIETAITEYLSIVDKLCPNLKISIRGVAPSAGTRASIQSLPKPKESSRFNSLINTPQKDITPVVVVVNKQKVDIISSNKNTNDMMSGVVKEGTLFKKRDHLKGWRERYFRMQDNFLHYYLEPTDAVPKRSMALAGVIVSADAVAQKGDRDYFLFTISHPNSKEVYILSSEFKVDADEWIEKIRELSLKASVDDAEGECVSASDTIVVENRDKAIDADYPKLAESSSNVPWTTNPSEVMKGTPGKYATKIENAVNAIQVALSPTAEGWQPLFEKNGVIAKRRPGSIITVRGDGMAYHPLHKVFALLLDHDRSSEYNSQIAEDRNLQSYSRHSSFQYLKFKQVWPTAQRDMCNISHWRIMPDNRVVIVSFTEEADNLCPLEDGIIRANLILGGYILTATAAGTAIQYIVQSDLKGTIPASVANFVANSQPMNVANLCKVLDKDLAKSGGSAPTTFSTTVEYSELLKYTTEPSHLDGVFGAAGEGSSNSNSAGASNVEDVHRGSSEGKTTSTNANTSTVTPPTTTNSTGHAKQRASILSLAKDPTQAAEAIDTHAHVATDAAVSQPPLHVQEKDEKRLSKRNSRIYKLKSTIRQFLKPELFSTNHVSPYSLLVIFMPTLLYYVIDSEKRSLGFFIGIIFAVRYLLKVHLGDPYIRSSSTLSMELGKFPSSRVNIRIPVDLGKMLRYLDQKREGTGSSTVEITPTHIVLKAVAMTLSNFQAMNGNIRFGYFYRNKNPGVDLSVSVEVSERVTMMMKLSDTDVKSVDVVAEEVVARTKDIRQLASQGSNSSSSASLEKVGLVPSGVNFGKSFLAILPPAIRLKVREVLHYLGTNLGVNISIFGVEASPCGVCSVFATPSRDGVESDVDISVVPQMAEDSVPITVTIGGVRFLPALDAEKKVTTSPVLNVSISIDSRAASLYESRQFCSRLQQYLNNPLLLDSADRRNSVTQPSKK